MRHRIGILPVTEIAEDSYGGQKTGRTIAEDCKYRVLDDGGTSEQNTCVISATQYPTYVWARVTPNNGLRDEELRTIKNKKSYSVVIRSDAYTLTGNEIIIHNGTEFSIATVTEDEMERYTTAVIWA